jgi:type I restriction enzyme S subunit
LIIPVAPKTEQQQLLDRMEPAFDYISALEDDIDLNLQKAEALRQSILKKAFAGELVPQDPADEPAAALLARLRAERENSGKKPVNRKSHQQAQRGHSK